MGFSGPSPFHCMMSGDSVTVASTSELSGRTDHEAPEAGLWRVTMKIDKKKVEEHKGRLASVSCLLTAEEANRLREGTLARLPRQCQARRTISPDLAPVST